MIQSPKKYKITNLVVYAALLMVAVSLFVLFKWSFASTNVLDVKNDPFPVRIINNDTDPTAIVVLNVDFCKNIDVTGKLRTSFVSATREIFLPEADEVRSTGCTTTENPVIVPKGTPADRYRIKFETTYNINPLKRGVINTFESKEFVLEKNN